MRVSRLRSVPSRMPRQEPGSTQPLSRCPAELKPAVNDSRDVSTPSSTKAGWRLLALLIAVSSVGPLSVNIILPAIPGLSVAFAADPAVVQLTVSLFFGGLGLAQLLLGSLSDRFGRRPVLLGGFVVTVLTSLAAASATNVYALVAARTAQAFGASTGIVIGRAIIRDLYA